MRLRPLLFILLALASFAPSRATAQSFVPDTAGVRAAVRDYVDGFYEGDSTRLVRSVRPDVFKYGYSRHRDSTHYRGMQMTWPQFHAFANRVKARNQPPSPNWRKDVELLDVLDQTAAAKLTAWWGTDYLLLAREQGRWMITHVLWQSPPPATPHH